MKYYLKLLLLLALSTILLTTALWPFSNKILYISYAQDPIEMPFEYVSPLPGATWVSTQTSIAIRQGDLLQNNLLGETHISGSIFQVTGQKSGRHQGQIVLSTDGKTLLFYPEHPFVPSEQVVVRISPGLKTQRGVVSSGFDFSFTTVPQIRPKNIQTNTDSQMGGISRSYNPSSTYTGTGNFKPYNPVATYLTLPPDYPVITVTSPVSNTGEGYIFISPHHKNWLEAKPYLLILDNRGEPVYYKKMTDGRPTQDFKKQANGMLSYWDAETNRHHVLDETYTLVKTYKPGNGYWADFHEFQLLANNHAFFLIPETREIDLSQIIPGGHPQAKVKGFIIQELDPENNVIFEWRSLDHRDPNQDPKAIEISDSNINLTGEYLDYMHTNSIEVDLDGHIPISSRHLDEVTKINRQTGEIIWRMGGSKKNEFTFINDPDNGFYRQHDARRLPNGNLTLFDNRIGSYSRGVEYEIDEVNKTATLIWSYENEPDFYSFIMGSTQRLTNGNTMLGWSSIWRDPDWTGTYPLLTEVTSTNQKALEFTVNVPIFTYRAYRFPWVGRPTTRPTLVVTTNPPTITLHYSWNGATEVSAYEIYGGKTPQPTTLITTQLKTGFETKTALTNMVNGPYYFWVRPLDKDGQPMVYSNQVVTGRSLYLPLLIKANS